MTPREWQRSPERKQLNVRLLRRIERHILEEPKRVAMTPWAVTDHFSFYGLKIPICNTVACIGGWAETLSGTSALKALRLPIGPDGLFYHTEWPSPYRERLALLKPQTKRYAQCVVDRIEHLIETGE